MGALAEGAHWSSVIAAYAVTGAVLAGLVWISLVEARRARRELEALDDRERRKDG